MSGLAMKKFGSPMLLLLFRSARALPHHRRIFVDLQLGLWDKFAEGAGEGDRVDYVEPE